MIGNTNQIAGVWVYRAVPERHVQQRVVDIGVCESLLATNRLSHSLWDIISSTDRPVGGHEHHVDRCQCDITDPRTSLHVLSTVVRRWWSNQQVRLQLLYM